MNKVYTKLIFYVHQRSFCKSRVSVLPFEIFIEIYISRFLIMPSYSATVSPCYNYLFLITITSQFPIYSPGSSVQVLEKTPFEFSEAIVPCCFDRRVAPKILKTYSEFSRQFSRVRLEELFSREHASVWCQSSVISGNFRNSKKICRVKSLASWRVCRPLHGRLQAYYLLKGTSITDLFLDIFQNFQNFFKKLG